MSYVQKGELEVWPGNIDVGQETYLAKVDDDRSILLHRPYYDSSAMRAQIVAAGVLGPAVTIPRSEFALPDTGAYPYIAQVAPYVIHTGGQVIMLMTATSTGFYGPDTHAWILPIYFTVDGNLLHYVGIDVPLVTNDLGTMGDYEYPQFQLVPFGAEGSNRFLLHDFANSDAHLGLVSYVGGALHVERAVRVETESSITPVDGYPDPTSGYHYGIRAAAWAGGNDIVTTGYMQYEYPDPDYYDGLGVIGVVPVVAFRYHGPGSWSVGDHTNYPNSSEFRPSDNNGMSVDGQAVLVFEDQHNYTGYHYRDNPDEDSYSMDYSNEGYIPYGTVYRRTGDGGTSAWYSRRGDAPFWRYNAYPTAVAAGHFATAEQDVGWCDIAFDGEANVWGPNGGFFFRMSEDRTSWWEVHRDGIYFVSNTGATRELVQGWASRGDSDWFYLEALGPYFFVESGYSHGYQEWEFTDSRNMTATTHGVMADPNAGLSVADDSSGGTAFQPSYYDVYYDRYQGRRVYERHYDVSVDGTMTLAHDYRIDPPGGQDSGRTSLLLPDANGKSAVFLLESDIWGHADYENYWVAVNGALSNTAHASFYVEARVGGAVGNLLFVVAIAYHPEDYDYKLRVVYFGLAGGGGWSVGRVHV